MIYIFFQLLKTRGFLDDENKYKLEDSFIRIEHQVLIYSRHLE